MRNSILAATIAAALAAHAQDWQLDVQFGFTGVARTNMWPSSAGYDMVVQPDGKILLAGSADSDIALVRYNADGTLDPTFDGDGLVRTQVNGDGWAKAMVLQADGKIVVAGGLIPGLGPTLFLVARYNADGSLDSSFDQDGMITLSIGVEASAATGVAIGPDDRIVACGWCYQPGGQPLHSEMATVRINSDGSLDASFDGDGICTVAVGPNSDASSVAITSDGSILLSGSSATANNWDFALARLQPDGMLDMTFGNAGSVITGDPVDDEASDAMVIQPDGKIILGGTTWGGALYEDFMLARYNTDGTLDASFAGGIVQASWALNTTEKGNALYLQPDGKILFGGSYGFGPMIYNSLLLARFHANGTLDDDLNGGIFPTMIGGDYAAVHALALAPDGAILAAGTSGTSTPLHTMVLARFVDVNGTGMDDAVSALNNVHLFPDPALDHATLEFDRSGNGPVDIRLVDVVGRTVSVPDHDLFMSVGRQRLDLDLSGLAAGRYTVVIEQENARAVIPLIKQ
jgi:uncharacterized delta-60 repeat protein